jgi:hypothetical protein
MKNNTAGDEVIRERLHAGRFASSPTDGDDASRADGLAYALEWFDGFVTTPGWPTREEYMYRHHLNNYPFDWKRIKKFNPGRHVVARLI